MSQTTQTTSKRLLCKYCQKVAIEFDVNRKSKSGKLLPIEVASGVPHSCSENPYNQQQKQVTTTQTDNGKTDRLYYNIIVEKLTNVETKLDKLLDKQ